MDDTDVPTQSDDPSIVSEESAPAAAEASAIATLSRRVEEERCTCGKPGGRCVCGAVEDLSAGEEQGVNSTYIYAIGRVDVRFPSLAVEKEFAQAAGREDTAGLSDRQALHAVLSAPENRYIARQLCYVLTIEGLDTYILHPRDPVDAELLIATIRPAPSPMDVDVIIGTRGPIAPPELCNGLTVPLVAFDQIYSFDRDSLIKSIPRPEGMTVKQFEPAANELFERILQVADNAGATDEHRALNYLAMRYPAIYATAADQYGRDFSLTGIDVVPSPLSGVRNVVEVIFSYTNRATDFTDKFFVRVDVTESFPFMITKLSPYFDR
jgi:hypothetical protein